MNKGVQAAKKTRKTVLVTLDHIHMANSRESMTLVSVRSLSLSLSCLPIKHRSPIHTKALLTDTQNGLPSESTKGRTRESGGGGGGGGKKT